MDPQIPELQLTPTPIPTERPTWSANDIATAGAKIDRVNDLVQSRKTGFEAAGIEAPWWLDVALTSLSLASRDMMDAPKGFSTAERSSRRIADLTTTAILEAGIGTASVGIGVSTTAATGNPVAGYVAGSAVYSVLNLNAKDDWENWMDTTVYPTISKAYQGQYNIPAYDTLYYFSFFK